MQGCPSCKLAFKPGSILHTYCEEDQTVICPYCHCIVIPETIKTESAFSTQVGGAHYKEYAIQPYEFFFRNQIPHHKAAIIRRILRYDHPTGKGIEDLNKIAHELELIKELQYPDLQGKET